MAQEKSVNKTKVCPVCGTRLSENASRCLVCGSQLKSKAETKSNTTIKTKRIPDIKLSLPIAIVLLLLFIALIGVLIFFVIQSNQPQTEVIATDVTPSLTPTQTLTPTETNTPTNIPTWTPLPPIEYTVQEGDVCSYIAAVFSVSIQSIIRENNLDASCSLSPGKVLMIPQPTPTASPQPTATSDQQQVPESSCQTVSYEVKSDDTLSKIAANYNVSMAAIREYSGMLTDVVYEGQYLTIPLCERKPTAGPTPTPTPPPPYPSPNLLLPMDGAAFNLTNDAITLQWAVVSELNTNELYAVTVEDLTSEDRKMIVQYVTDTKFILPVSFRPTDQIPHIMRWWVTVVRQINTGDSAPIYEPAGLLSEKRVFSWIGIDLPNASAP